MSLPGKIEAHPDLFYVPLVILKQGKSVKEGSQPTENEKSQIKKCLKLPKGVTAKLLKNIFIVILKPCNLRLLYVYLPTKLHLNLLN
jgi:hypothetical protein